MRVVWARPPTRGRDLTLFLRRHIMSRRERGSPGVEPVPWDVILDDDFAAWLRGLEGGPRAEIVAAAEVLSRFGPNLGRPRVDTLKGSAYRNLKELRVQYRGEPWRVLFAFDPRRAAILLLGGNKVGDETRWYKENIPIAERRYARHLDRLAREEGGPKQKKRG